MLRTGLDRLLDNDAYLAFLSKKKIGFLGHAASVTREYEHAIDALTKRGVRPTRLFGPEHGLRGQAQMMVAVDHDVDPVTGIPVTSLYGHNEASLQPQVDAVADLDLILIDIQDVGSRYYTYVATALKLCEIATEHHVGVMVLDRPNPIGRKREGPTIREGYHSFVGELGVPNRHGLTTAELFTWAVQQGRALEYEIIAVEGWVPAHPLTESEFPWAMPSPNMPTIQTALVYPGGCLLEATNVSEGRGTTRPFEIFGAPWINATQLQERLNGLELPGVQWRGTSFCPTFDKFTGKNCEGLQAHVTNVSVFEPLRTYASLIWTIRDLWPNEFGWRPGAYEFIEDIPAMDLLAGSPQLRTIVEESGTIDDIARWASTPTELAMRCERAEHYV